MGMKKIWTAAFKVLPRTHLQHRYENGKLTGASHRVRLLLTVSDGTQEGRELEVWLSEKEARGYAMAIRFAADVAREKNQEAGCLDV